MDVGWLDDWTIGKYGAESSQIQGEKTRSEIGAT